MYGGDVITVNSDYPWVVLILSQISRSQVKTCSGSVISPHWALTAAHCLDNDSESVSARHISINVFRFVGSFVKYEAHRTFTHPKYAIDVKKERHDLALISTTKAIGGPPGVLMYPSVYPNDTCTILGFGQRGERDGRQKPTLAMLRDRLANFLLSLPRLGCSRLKTARERQQVNLIPKEICHRSHNKEVLCLLAVNGIGPCVGDSGSPIVCGGEIAGVCSRAIFNQNENGCGEFSMALVFYEMVDNEWITNTMANNHPSSAPSGTVPILALLFALILPTWEVSS